MKCLLCSEEGMVEVNTPGGIIYLCARHQGNYLRFLTQLRVSFDAHLIITGEDGGREESKEAA